MSNESRLLSVRVKVSGGADACVISTRFLYIPVTRGFDRFDRTLPLPLPQPGRTPLSQDLNSAFSELACMSLHAKSEFHTFDISS